MGRHTNWRDCQAWKDEGLDMSSTSNAAVKLYDASLCQLVGWYEEKSVGGFVEGISRMIAADQTFLMGHVLKNGIHCLAMDGKSLDQDPDTKTAIQEMCKMAEATTVKPREKMHAEAVKLISEDQPLQAFNIYQDILLEYPTDMLAIKYSELCCINIGYQVEQRDFKYRLLPYWNPNIPLYSNLYGMVAFGEMETGLFDKAEKNARKGIELNPLDGWAVHALAHVMADTGRCDELVTLLSSTKKDWSTNDMLACHNNWHFALGCVEKGELGAALEYYDDHLKQYNHTGFQMTDRASLLLRLQMLGVDVGDRWNDLYELLRPSRDNNISCFHDMHTVMSCIGANNRNEAEKLLDSLRAALKNSSKSNYWRTVEDVGIHIYEALLAYDEHNYAKAVDCLMPIRHNTRFIGGSNAQRDVVSLLLIHCAMQSDQTKHQKLARNLIHERRAHKDTPLTDKLMMQLLDKHDD